MADESEKRSQEEIHTTLQDILNLEEGKVLTGWVISYETIGLNNVKTAGHMYGLSNMTTWGALGLIEWTRTESIPGSLED